MVGDCMQGNSPITLTLASLLRVGPPVLIRTWEPGKCEEKLGLMMNCSNLASVNAVVNKVS